MFSLLKLMIYGINTQNTEREEIIMSMHFVMFFFVLFAYFLGSLPFGFWVCKIFKGKNFDIRDFGSGNIGFTNVLREIGPIAGSIVLVLDMAKGFIPAYLSYKNFGISLAGVCVVSAALGHIKSWYFYWLEGKFSGGKAVATLAGGIAIFQPIVFVFALIAWIIILCLTQYMSVASTVGAITCVVAGYCLHLPLSQMIVFWLAMLMVFMTHTKNYVRLIHRTERRVTDKPIEPSEGLSAFVVHLSTLEDLKQSPLTAWIVELLRRDRISERMVRKIIRFSQIIVECGQLKGINTLNGQVASVRFISVPWVPEDVKNPVYTKIVLAMLEGAAITAHRLGCSVIGLGALTSTIGEGGLELQKRLRARRLSIQVCNGAAYTIGAIMEVFQNDHTDISINKLNIAVLGANGIIGYGVASIVSEIDENVVCVLHRKDGKFEKPTPFAQVITSENLALLKDADVVFCCTSSPDPIFTTQNANELLKTGVEVYDVGVPSNFDDAILAIRPDIKLRRCGLLLFPGDFVSDIDTHFGKYKTQYGEKPLNPSCLGETVTLSLTKNFKCASVGSRIRPENVQYFVDNGKKFGFQIIPSAKSEVEIYTGQA